jgi:hypothetical protein
VREVGHDGGEDDFTLISSKELEDFEEALEDFKRELKVAIVELIEVIKQLLSRKKGGHK